MTEMTQQRRSSTGDEEQSATSQAKQKIENAGGEVRQQVGHKAQELRSQAGEGVRQQLDGRSTQAGEQVSATANALRRVGGQLREEGNTTTAQYAEQAAQPVERLGRYLTEADGERLLRDAEQFARRRPWVAVAGGAALGFLAARFIKASSTHDAAAEQSGYVSQRALPTAAATPRSYVDDQPSQ